MKQFSIITIFFIILVITIIISLSLGRYSISISDLTTFLIWKITNLGYIERSKQELLETVILEIRLPRILAAALIGSALSVAGASFQSMFINPLASPGILGVLAGASFGYALGILISKSWIMVQILTVLFGFLAVLIAIAIARIYRIDSIIMLVLGGVISSSLFTSLVSIVKYVADPYNQLPAIVYWLMGGLTMVDKDILLIVSLPILMGIVGLILHGRLLNALSMGEEEAKSLGIDVKKVRFRIIFLATLVSSLTVMIGGVINWVGLIIPHICRFIVGPNNQILLPLSALVGATYLIIVDDISRLIFPSEIPLGILTSLIGIPFFIVILKNAHRGWK